MNFWVKKTIVGGRIDRLEGDRSLGKALWSPQADKRGGDIYKNMRLVKQDAIILHIVDNRSIYGVSEIKKGATETNEIEGTGWIGPSYLLELKDSISVYPLPYFE